jgi:hypothetical protein
MKAKSQFAVATLAAFSQIHHDARAEASSALPWTTSNSGCHLLMTEQECAEHRVTLAALPSIEQRFAYLEAHGIPLRDRQLRCDCKRNTPAIVYYPDLHLAHR